MTPDEIIKEAQARLVAGGFLAPRPPDWHPYYWHGRFDAARETKDTHDEGRRAAYHEMDDQRRARKAQCVEKCNHPLGSPGDDRASGAVLDEVRSGGARQRSACDRRRA